MFGTNKHLVFVCLIVVVLILALSGGGLVHTLLPHVHVGQEVAWNTLHTALSHRDEKFLALSLAVSMTIFSAALLFLPVLLRGALLDRAAQPVQLATALRRGTLPYRKFR